MSSVPNEDNWYFSTNRLNYVISHGKDAG